ncbi:hypothetical protein I553_6112 [Mycobacterium xenopi 4042]|uniref:Uncharacterized protein n=1 Tax=Mycobacterium xenopi 4042 TaxID=1299334 RepID=X8BDR3_MYCXE|nr:hypothetical protein I553_6112 [Mycobacterium xenopi 4042]
MSKKVAAQPRSSFEAGSKWSAMTRRPRAAATSRKAGSPGRPG